MAQAQGKQGMRSETLALRGVSAGTRREVTMHRYGGVGARPKVYLQAGLHADEMPGVLVLHHLMRLLDMACDRGDIVGEVCVVPAANPIGLSQWTHQRPLGRQDAESLQNFNRGYPSLGPLVADALAGQLQDDPAQNLYIIRRAFRAELAAMTPRTDVQELQIALMSWSCDADHVLDLHCDHVAVMHLYASTAQPEVTRALCQAVGARLALIEDMSGGNAFDEAHTVPWRHLRARFGDKVPMGCFSATLEYRGQFDVDDVTALRDAGNLMGFLSFVGALQGHAKPSFPDALHLPLGGVAEVVAPQGGVVTWAVQPGAEVTVGQVLCHVTDPVSRRRLAVSAPVTGMLFRTELWRSCLRGQSLGHVAGETVVRRGDLLTPQNRRSVRRDGG
jgi:predicted deacylase